MENLTDRDMDQMVQAGALLLAGFDGKAIERTMQGTLVTISVKTSKVW